MLGYVNSFPLTMVLALLVVENWLSGLELEGTVGIRFLATPASHAKGENPARGGLSIATRIVSCATSSAVASSEVSDRARRRIAAACATSASGSHDSISTGSRAGIHLRMTARRRSGTAGPADEAAGIACRRRRPGPPFRAGDGLSSAWLR